MKQNNNNYLENPSGPLPEKINFTRGQKLFSIYSVSPLAIVEHELKKK